MGLEPTWASATRTRFRDGRPSTRACPPCEHGRRDSNPDRRFWRPRCFRSHSARVYAWGRIRTCSARSRRFYGPAAVPYGVPRVDVVERAAPVGTVARLARYVCFGHFVCQTPRERARPEALFRSGPLRTLSVSIVRYREREIRSRAVTACRSCGRRRGACRAPYGSRRRGRRSGTSRPLSPRRSSTRSSVRSPLGRRDSSSVLRSAATSSSSFRSVFCLERLAGRARPHTRVLRLERTGVKHFFRSKSKKVFRSVIFSN